MVVDHESDCLFIVVPYRDREEHLRIFLPHMERFLLSQPHRFIVVEQCDDKPFNKGALLNIAFTLLRDRTSCLCFHDVDMLPVDDPRYYTKTRRTTHLANSIEQFGYKLPYPEYLGGVFLAPTEEFVAVNGFSNEYWGWGNEDDDLWARYMLTSIDIDRKPGRYQSLHHSRPLESLANTRRMMRTLAAVAQLPLSLEEHERFKHLQESCRPSCETAIPEPVHPAHDGLTTLTFTRLERLPLRERFSFDLQISAAHELIRATL